MTDLSGWDESRTSKLIDGKLAEGVVIRPMREIEPPKHCPLDRLILKRRCPRYLAKE